MRLFLAINFNSETRRRLVALREELRSKSQSGNFSRDENLHLTLAFIGEAGTNELNKVKAVIDTMTFEPFGAVIERVGLFKRVGGDIWWAGLREDGSLMNLQRELSEQLRESGFTLENRRYSPHITLGREVVTDCKPWKIEPFGEMASKVDLMKSERINGKLTYTAIYEK